MTRRMTDFLTYFYYLNYSSYVYVLQGLMKVSLYLLSALTEVKACL